MTEERSFSPKPGPSGVIARPDVNVVFHNDDDPVYTEILNEIESDGQNETEYVTFQEIIPSPVKKKAKITSQKAINSRGILLEKQLFASPKETVVPAKKTTKKSSKQGLKKAQASKSKESWFCEICCKNVVKDMRKCDTCYKYVHEECVGLTEEDKGPFTCPNCDSYAKANFRL